MNEDVKKLWVEAMRSGRFIHGKGRLKGETLIGREVCHCVIGVLCEVYKETHPDTKLEYNSSGTNFGFVEGKLPAGTKSLVSHEVNEWAGISNDFDICLEVNGKSAPLWMVNDRGTMTFPELADLIEEQL
jgi:hypothetical protein